MGTARLSEPDFYQALGVLPSASHGEIRSAFVDLIVKHRDRPGETDVAMIERARQINIAYNTLADPAKRRSYDQSRGIFFAPGASSADAEHVEKHISQDEEPAASAPPKQPENTASIAPAGIATAGAASTLGAQDDVPETPASFAAEAPAMPEAPESPLPLEEDEPPILLDHRTAPILHDAPAADHRPRRNKAWLAGGALAAVVALGALVPAFLLQPDRKPDQLGASSSSSAAPEQVQVGEVSEPELAQASPSQTGSDPDGFAEVDSVEQPQGLQQVEVDAFAGSPAEESGPEPQLASEDRDEDDPAQRAPSPPPQKAEVAAATAPEPPRAVVQPVGVTPRPGATVARPPAPSRSAPAKWLSGGLLDRDNPRGRLQGTVEVRFTVDRGGRVGGCRQVGGSGTPALGSVTCQLVEQRLRFNPALNAAGQPVASELQTSYNWGQKRRRR